MKLSNIVAISNHKGGVGKTTSSINIGMGLSLLGKKVLLIDLDPQANLTQSLGVNLSNEEHNIYGALKGYYKLEPIKIVEGLDLIASTLDLSVAEIELSSEAGREYILSEILEPLKNKYDYILIDCPPSLGLLTLNAFVASHSIFIPMQAEYLALQGLAKMIEVIEKVKKRLNKNLELGSVIITQYDSRKVLNKDIVQAVENRLKSKVFKTKIRDNIALAEAPTQGLDIFRYNEKSYGAKDYLDLCKEIIKLKK